MPDLRKTFRAMDDVPVPDLRTDIERREPRELLMEPRRSGPARVATATLALAVFAAAAVFAWRAFVPGPGPQTQGAAGSGGPHPGTPGCVASQLSARVAGTEGAAGTSFETIALTNVSASRCHLRGSLPVVVLSPSGSPLPIREQPGLPEGPELRPSTVVLRPGEEASLVVATHDVNVGNQPCLDAAALRITPTGSRGSLQVPFSPEVQICDGTIWVAPVKAFTG